MSNKLREYFPMIQEREKLLGKIQGDLRLRDIFNSWKIEQREEFLDFCTGVRGVKILYDSFFKEVLNPEYTPERLEMFLSVLLKRKVRIVRILPNDSTRISDETSLLITDIIVELEDGSLANVEIQKIGYMFPGERCACYSADMLLRQYKRVRSTQGENFSYSSVKNVYLIVIYENSPRELKRMPEEYYHRSQQVFDTGLQLNLLQEFIMIPLDIFRKNMDNKIIETPLEAWLTFLTNDEPERMVELITNYPEFKPMYETVYQMCQNVERMMNMFSEELRILDRNTVKYMIEEQEQELEKQQVQLEEQERQLEEQERQLEKQEQQLEEQERQLEEQEQQLEKQERQLEEQEQQLEKQEQQLEKQEQQLEEQREQLEEQRKSLNTYKETQKSVIEKLLYKNFEVEEISSILNCDVAYIEAVKQGIK